MLSCASREGLLAREEFAYVRHDELVPLHPRDRHPIVEALKHGRESPEERLTPNRQLRRHGASGPFSRAVPSCRSRMASSGRRRERFKEIGAAVPDVVQAAAASPFLPIAAKRQAAGGHEQDHRPLASAIGEPREDRSMSPRTCTYWSLSAGTRSRVGGNGNRPRSPGLDEEAAMTSWFEQGQGESWESEESFTSPFAAGEGSWTEASEAPAPACG